MLNGAAEGFWLLAAALAARHARPRSSTPAFGEPAAALQRPRARRRRCIARSADDGFALTPVPDDAELVFVTNPCNPTGRAPRTTRSPRSPDPAARCVVDESFMDFVAAPAAERRRARRTPSCCAA